MHYSPREFHGKDQSRAFECLYSVVAKEEPESIFSAGDFANQATLEMFQPILEKKGSLRSIVITVTCNLKNYDGTGCWLQDGVIRELEDIKIAGINGNIAERKRSQHRRTIDLDFSIARISWVAIVPQLGASGLS